MAQFKPFGKPAAHKGADPQNAEQENIESVDKPDVDQDMPTVADDDESSGVRGSDERELAMENPTGYVDRQTRLAVLAAAAEFLGQLSKTHTDVRSDHVLVLAERWLAWVNQDEE
jgi:hypothetical protein